jgi:O-antigen/teichoic acid export membrane protein
VLVVAAGRGVRGWQEGVLAGQIVLLAGAAAPVWRRIGVGVDRQAVHDLFSIGIPMLPAFFATLVVQHANKYLLQWMHGLDAVGVYSVGFNLGVGVSIIVMALQTSWMPFFMSFYDRQEEAGPLFSRLTTYYVLGMGALTLLLFSGSGLLVCLLTPTEYHAAFAVVGLAGAAQFFSGLFLLLLPPAYFADRVRAVGGLQVVAAVLALAVNVVLIRAAGVMGAAAALALGSACAPALLAVFNRSIAGSRVRLRWEIPRLLAFAALALAIGGMTSWPRDLQLGREVLLASCGTLATVLGVLCLTTRPERDAVLVALRNMTRGKVGEPTR